MWLQLSADDWIAHIVSALSVIGAAFILLTYYKFPAIRNQGRRLLVLLSIMDLFFALSLLLPDDINYTWCHVQGLIAAYSSSSSFFFSSGISIYIYLMISAKPELAMSFCTWLYIVAMGYPLAFLVIFLVLQADFGSTNEGWCTVSENQAGGTTYVFASIWGPVMFNILLSLVFNVLLWRRLKLFTQLEPAKPTKPLEPAGPYMIPVEAQTPMENPVGGPDNVESPDVRVISQEIDKSGVPKVPTNVVITAGSSSSISSHSASSMPSSSSAIIGSTSIDPHYDASFIIRDNVEVDKSGVPNFPTNIIIITAGSSSSNSASSMPASSSAITSSASTMKRYFSRLTQPREPDKSPINSKGDGGHVFSSDDSMSDHTNSSYRTRNNSTSKKKKC